MQRSAFGFVPEILQMAPLQWPLPFVRERSRPRDAAPGVRRRVAPHEPVRAGRPSKSAERLSEGVFPMAQRFFAESAESGITLLTVESPAGSGGK